MRIPTLAAAALMALSTSFVVNTVANAPGAAAAPPTCSQVSGVLDPTGICSIRATDPAYSLSIAYPVGYPDQQAVYDYVAQIRDGFLNVAKAPGLHQMPYELETTATEFASAVPPRRTQSVVFKTFQDVGGAHPQTFYRSFTWDQVLRKPITIDDLFKPGTSPFAVILPIVVADLEKQSGQSVSISPGVGLDPQKYQNFAVTDDALIFFFGQGELLPESAGAIQVSVPRGPIEAMIA